MKTFKELLEANLKLKKRGYKDYEFTYKGTRYFAFWDSVDSTYSVKIEKLDDFETIGIFPSIDAIKKEFK